MQALVVNQPNPGDLRWVEDHPEPTRKPDEVLIGVDLAGVCSTDLEIARGYMGFRGIPGHEFVGTVLDGDERLCGRRVVVEINCPPPGFAAADLDARKHAPDRTVLGILGRDGAFAERLAAPAANCLTVPDRIDDEQAVFVEPLAAAIQMLRDHRVRRDERIAVVGAGRLGLLCAQVLARECDDVQVIVRRESRAALCSQLGLRPLDVACVTADQAWDTIVECTGAPNGLRFALQHVRPRGTIVLKSTYAEPPEMDLSPIVIDEVRVIGSRCGPFDTALQWLVESRVQVTPLISARFALRDGVAAFAAARDPDNTKVLIKTSAP